MSNNRHLINNLDILRPTQLLDKGLPLPFLSGKYRVDEGWTAVITEGGAYRETLGPGTHFLSKYHMFRDLLATAVNTRVNTLTVSTVREFTIARPVPVEVNLDLAVEYRVVDPRRVATEITTPLTNLYDRVLQAVRGAVVFATIDEIRTQGEGIARAALQHLQGMQLPKVLGIEVLNVLVTTIKATDTGSDALASQAMKEYGTYRDWQLDAAMLSQSQVTPQWLMVHRPEIYQQLMAGNQALLKEMIDKGLLDPAGFLNQSSNAPGYDYGQLMGGFGFPGLPGGLGAQPGGQSGSGSPQPQGAAQLPGAAGASSIHGRMNEEVELLRKTPGVRIDTTPGVNANGIPDGSYNLKIEAPRNSGGWLTLYLSCPAGYPQQPPLLDVEVDEQAVAYQSPILRRWTGQYLVEIVREVKQSFG